MKKIFIKALCFVLVLCTCAIAFAACADKPELDFDKAKAHLEECGYEVTVKTSDLEPGMKKALKATKTSGKGEDVQTDYIYIYILDSLKTAKLTYNMVRLDIKWEKEEEELCAKYYEHILEEYQNEMKSEEIDDYTESLKDTNEALENFRWVYGMWGKTVWYGTTAAVEASK